MASQIDIVNRALARINASLIASFADDSKEAHVARIEWDPALEATLRAHDWGFASTRRRLALLAATPEGWRYAYALPADCLMLRRVLPSPAAGPDEPTARFAIGSEDGRTAVLTDVPDAVAHYTVKINEAARFDAQFAEALVWQLATAFALAIKGDAELASAAGNLGERAALAAGARNAQESGFEDDPISSFERARWA